MIPEKTGGATGDPPPALKPTGSIGDPPPGVKPTPLPPSRPHAPGKPVRCYVLRDFAHGFNNYRAGEWIDLEGAWFAHHQKAGNVTDSAGFLAHTQKEA